MIKPFLLLAFCFAISCNATKNDKVTESTTTSEISKQEEEMIEQGYKKGTIVFSEQENDCPFTVQIEDGNYLLDPISMDESFKENGMKVWLTYRGLRMKNRCNKANPIEITDIQKREE